MCISSTMPFSCHGFNIKRCSRAGLTSCVLLLVALSWRMSSGAPAPLPPSASTEPSSSCSASLTKLLQDIRELVKDVSSLHCYYLSFYPSVCLSVNPFQFNSVSNDWCFGMGNISLCLNCQSKCERTAGLNRKI